VGCVTGPLQDVQRRRVELEAQWQILQWQVHLLEAFSERCQGHIDLELCHYIVRCFELRWAAVYQQQMREN
jgi:hypothetical protein